MNRKILSVFLFIFSFQTLVTPVAWAQQDTIIQSRYLNNGVVYWDSTWSVPKKTEQYHLNLAKALQMFESIRDGLTCLESDQNSFETYYCKVKDRYEADQGSVKSVIFPTVMAWLVTHALIYSVSEIKVDGSDISKWYATPYDRMVLNSPDELYKYLRLHESGLPFLRSDYVVHLFDQMNKKMKFTVLDKNATGFDLEISRTHNGEIQKVQLTREQFHQMYKGLGIKPYGFNEVYVSKYLDGIFQFGSDFFTVDESNTSLYNRVHTFKLELHKLSNQTMAMERPDFSPHLVKWYKSKRYQNMTHLKIVSGFLLLGIVAGVSVMYFVSNSTDPENTFVAENALQISDLEDLKTTVMDREPSFAARLAVLHDEIIQGVREFNHRK
jgi:hypothetical protein